MIPADANRQLETNYQRILEDMKRYRLERGSDDSFSSRLSEAQHFVDTLVPMTFTNTQRARFAAREQAYYSYRSAFERGIVSEKEHGDMWGHTTWFERTFGLDDYVYAWHGKYQEYGDVAFLFSPEVLERNNTVCATDNLFDYYVWKDNDIEYTKTQLIPGSKTKEFTTHLIATVFDDPDEYFRHDLRNNPGPGWELACHEILVHGQIGLEDVLAVAVAPEKKETIADEGIPEEKIVEVDELASPYESQHETCRALHEVTRQFVG